MEVFDLYYPGNSSNGPEAADRKRGIVGSTEAAGKWRSVAIPCGHGMAASAIQPGRNTCSVCDRQFIAVPRREE